MRNMRKYVVFCLMSVVLFGTVANAAPIIEYLFDETSGLTAADTSGNGYDGTLSAGFPGDDSQWVSGLVDGALDFGGNNKVLAGAASTVGQIYTISFFMKADVADNQDESRIYTEAHWTGSVPPSTLSGITIRANASGSISAFGMFDHSVFQYNFTSTGVVQDDTWHHVALTNDYGDVKLYIDGQLDGSATYVATDHNYTTPNTYGFSHTTVGFIGTLDQFRSYDTALDAGEIADIADAGLNPPVGNFACNPGPDDGGDAPNDVVLNWTAGDNANSHDVYFGTDFADVNDAGRQVGDIDGDSQVDFNDLLVIADWWLSNAEGSEPYANPNREGIVNLIDLAIVANDWRQPGNATFKGNQAGTTYDPGILEIGQSYYWRIDEVNGPDAWRGNVWGFTVVENTYFIQPTSPYLIERDEATYEIIANAGDVTSLQQTLDAARLAHPTDVIIVRIPVPLTVSDVPLMLGSRVCVSLEGCGQIRAAENMTASALISIENAEFVSVTRGNTALIGLNGNNVAAYGVWVSNSGKVNLDNLAISDCTVNGVYYSGRGDGQLNDAGSVTRCRISNAGVGGVWVRNGARFVLMDNTIADCGTYGIDMVSQSATVLGNQCTGNQTGIRLDSPVGIDGPEAVVTRNELEQNSIGLELGDETRRVLATENIIHQNTVGIKLRGTRNHLFNNDLDNGSEFDLGGTENIIARHDSVTSSEASGGSTRYFNPPTAANPHNDPVIVAGMGRHDITVTQSGPTPMSTADVQPTLNNARSQYPNDVIVLWLNGTFVADGDFTGLTIPDNTCVVLDGTIYAEGAGMDATTSSAHDYEKGETTGGTQVILMTGSGYSSFSGGIIDGKDLPAYGIYAPGNHVGLIDGVRVLDANNNNIGTCSHSGDGTPLFIRGCELLGHKKVNRGVWVHVCNNVHSISNYAEGFTADAFDVDAAGHWNTVLFNTAHDNNRSGVFVEEAASNNIVTGNTFTGPQGPGLLTYDAHGGDSRCENNIIVANKISCPGGLSFRHARNTFIFNNNIQTGGFNVQWSEDNYMSQNIAVNGVVNRNVAVNPYFAAPYFIATCSMDP